MNQSPFGAKAKAKIMAAAKKFGITVGDQSSGRSEEYEMAAVERRFTTATLERRDGTGDDGPRVGGYAAKFNQRSRNLGGFVEVVTPSFFDRSKGNEWPDVLCRYNHDDNQLLGTTGARTLSLRIDTIGLDYEVVPPKAANYLVELVQRGDVQKSSFAFRVPAGGEDWGLDPDTGYPLRSLTSGILVDVAPVNTPAYVDTTTALRALRGVGEEAVQQQAEMRKLGVGPEAALRSLAQRMSAEYEDVVALAEADELRKFFARTDNAGPAVRPKPKPKLLGAAALLDLLERRSDPWE
jgi:HK97 family phage prohead protease